MKKQFAFAFVLLWVTSFAFPSHWKHKVRRDESTVGITTDSLITDASTEDSTNIGDSQSPSEGQVLEEPSESPSGNVSSQVETNSEFSSSEDGISSSEESVTGSIQEGISNVTTSASSDQAQPSKGNSKDEESTTQKRTGTTLKIAEPISTLTEESLSNSSDYGEYDEMDDENETSQSPVSTSSPSISTVQNGGGVSDSDSSVDFVPLLNGKRSIPQFHAGKNDDLSDSADDDNGDMNHEYKLDSHDGPKPLLRRIKSIRKLGIRRRYKIRNSPQDIFLQNPKLRKSERRELEKIVGIEHIGQDKDLTMDLQGDKISALQGGGIGMNLVPSVGGAEVDLLDPSISRSGLLGTNVANRGLSNEDRKINGQETEVVKRQLFVEYPGTNVQSQYVHESPLVVGVSQNGERDLQAQNDLPSLTEQRNFVDNPKYYDPQTVQLPFKTNKEEAVFRRVPSNDNDNSTKLNTTERDENSNRTSGITEPNTMLPSTIKLPKEAQKVMKIVEQEDLDWIHKRNTKKKFGDFSNELASSFSPGVVNFTTATPENLTEARIRKNPQLNKDEEEVYVDDDLDDSDDDFSNVRDVSPQNHPPINANLPKDVGKREDTVDASIEMEPNHKPHGDSEDFDRPALYGKKVHSVLPNEDTLVNGDEAWDRLYKNNPNDKEAMVNIKIQIRNDRNHTEETPPTTNLTSTMSVTPSVEISPPNLNQMMDQIPIIQQRGKMILELKPKNMIIEFRKSKDDTKLIPVKEVVHFAKESQGIDISGQKGTISH